jgi:hypothetical protein
MAYKTGARMTAEHKAVLIDPYKEEVTDVTYNGDYKQIYEHIKVDCFALVRLADDDDVFVDDEGLLKLEPSTKFFALPDYPQPLAGYGLVLGNDNEGESISAHHDAAFYRERVKFMTMRQFAAISAIDFG